MDSSTTLLISILVGVLLLLLTALVVALLVMLNRTQQSSRSTLLSLLAYQTQENQNLRNQLLSKDPYVLATLQQATSPNSTSDEVYIPTADEAHLYEERLRASDYVQEGLDDDLNAAGWDPAIRRDSPDSGTPVTFG